MSLRWRMFRLINRVGARMRGSVGWCMMAYKFCRHGVPEGDGWAGIPPKGRLMSWWGAFMFEYKLSTEEMK